MKKQEIKDAVRKYVIAEVFNGTAPAEFSDDMLIVSTRLMDSIITLNMVNHFEELLGVEFQAHEVNIDNLDSVNLVSNFLAAKAGATD